MKFCGWFSSPEQLEPEFDPGLFKVECPYCHNNLVRPVTTISLMIEGDSRSYFYRAHARCYWNAEQTHRDAVDHSIVDAVTASKNVN